MSGDIIIGTIVFTPAGNIAMRWSDDPRVGEGPTEFIEKLEPEGLGRIIGALPTRSRERLNALVAHHQDRVEQARIDATGAAQAAATIAENAKAYHLG